MQAPDYKGRVPILVALLVLAPLGLFKLVEIIIYVLNHIRWEP